MINRLAASVARMTVGVRTYVEAGVHELMTR